MNFMPKLPFKLPDYDIDYKHATARMAVLRRDGSFEDWIKIEILDKPDAWVKPYWFLTYWHMSKQRKLHMIVDEDGRFAWVSKHNDVFLGNHLESDYAISHKQAKNIISEYVNDVLEY